MEVEIVINFNAIKNENICYENYSISVKKYVEKKNENSSDDERSDVDCFKELCEKFPAGSFVVEDNSLEILDQEWLPKRFSGISNLQSFSNLGTLSIAFDIKIFEKAANEPEFMENLTKFVEYLNNEWSSKEAQCISDGMKNMFVEMFLKEDGTLGYTTGEYPDQFDLYYRHEKNLLEKQTDDIAKRILEEYERKKLEGLFSMMDKIHEDSEELKKQNEEFR